MILPHELDCQEQRWNGWITHNVRASGKESQMKKGKKQLMKDISTLHGYMSFILNVVYIIQTLWCLYSVNFMSFCPPQADLFWYNLIFWPRLAADTVPDPKLHKMDFFQNFGKGGCNQFLRGGVYSKSCGRGVILQSSPGIPGPSPPVLTCAIGFIF